MAKRLGYLGGPMWRDKTIKFQPSFNSGWGGAIKKRKKSKSKSKKK